MFKLHLISGPLPDQVADLLADDERDGALEVSSRADTNTIWAESADGKPVMYAVFGLDKGDMVAVYYARSFVIGMGPMMMKQFFGASKILGVPMRVHAQDIRDIAIKARVFGAKFSQPAVDADGILMGVFSDVIKE